MNRVLKGIRFIFVFGFSKSAEMSGKNRLVSNFTSPRPATARTK